MGRKSLATERTNQILDAFEVCITQYGLEGATLQRVAKQGDINIGMIHHYIGNRDDLLRAMVGRFIEGYRAEFVDFVANVPAFSRIPHLLDDLFNTPTDATDIILGELITISSRDEFVRGLLHDVYEFLVGEIAGILHHAHPNTQIEKCRQVAFNLLALAFGGGAFLDVGFGDGYRQGLLATAQQLITDLEKEK